MEQYLIPANSKRSKLIFGIFRKKDLIIEGIGFLITFISFILIQPNNIYLTILVLLPLLITSFLVIPVANYHNVLCVIQNIFSFCFKEVNQFIWKGWCTKDEFK